MERAFTGAGNSILLVLLDILWLILMLYLSHASGEHTARHSKALHKMTRVNEHILRKMAHLFCYVILGMFWSLTVGKCAWIFTLIPVAVLDEWTKKYVPGRHMSIAEMGINIAGAAIGVGIILILTV